jgi:methyl-accepting chemotaxis protein
MLSGGDIGRVTGIVRAVSASMEARFLDMGGQLGTAVDTIGTLTLTFDRLANELKGENLRDATQQLSHVMSAVATAVFNDGEGAVFQQLADLMARIQERIAQMGKAVSDIGMLAMNARIEAAIIGDAGLDFAIFTSEIGRTLGLAPQQSG